MRTATLSAALACLAWATTSFAQTGIPVTDARGPRPVQTAPTPSMPTGAQPATPHGGDGPRPGWRPPRGWRGYHGPVTIINGVVQDQIIAYPFQFKLPAPAFGLVWMRSNNDAVLFDTVNRTIVEVRSRWFG